MKRPDTRRLALLLLCGAADTPQKPAPVATMAARLEQMGKARAEGLLGQPVTDAKGDVFGNVVDVLIDADGTPHAAVIEFTGFLGIGARQVAVDWKVLAFSVQGDHIAIRVPLDPDKLKATPDYKRGAQSVPVATRAAPVTAHAPMPPR